MYHERAEHMPTKANVLMGHLTDKDAELFYKLWMGLLDYVNQRYKIEPSLGRLSSPKNLDIDKLLPVRDRLWEDRRVIDEYVKASKKALSPDEISILEGWKKAICGDFIMMKHLKKYSVMMQPEALPLLYGVIGIYSTWDEMISQERLPVTVECALLPFKGKIIYDSMIRVDSVIFGAGYRKSFNASYRSSKARYGIIEAFDSVEGILAKRASDSIRRKRIQEEVLDEARDDYEEAAAWHAYLRDNTTFPFEAICEKQMICSPLYPDEQATVTGLADMEFCHNGITVIIKWQGRKFAVPLEQLRPVDGAKFGEAIEDWKFWVSA